MGAILLREDWGRQPQHGVGIDYANPIVRGLVSAILATSSADLHRGLPVTFANGFTTNKDGVAALGGTAFPIRFGTPLLIPAGSDFTCVFTVHASELLGTNPGLWRAGNGGTAGNSFCIVQGASFRPWIRWAGTDILKPTAGEALVLGNYYTIAYRVISGVSAAIAWNGKISNTASHTTATPAFDIQVLGAQNIAGERVGPVNGALFFSRGLSDDELVSITNNPWQILEDEILTVPFASSANADLAAAAVVNPAASAAIALSVPMVAAGIVVATSGGAMQLALPMSGNATGQASTAGGVSLSVPMAVSALIQALAAAGLSLADPLAANAAGVASSSGNVTLNISMAGAALIEALAVADLTVIGDGMSGAAIVQPSAAANMSLGLPLATSSLVVSNTSGSLTQIVPMQASSAAASLATGGLDIAVTMNTAALIEALAVVSLTNDMNMGGIGAANASTMGNLTLRVNMSTAAIIQAVAAGGLAGNGQLIGTPGYRVTRAPRSWKVTRKPRSWRVAE